jgi:hypothetical protein
MMAIGHPRSPSGSDMERRDATHAPSPARRRIVGAGAAALLLAHRPLVAQPAAAIRRVGLSRVAEVSVPPHTAFKQQLVELGWHEGRNVEYRVVDASDVADGRVDAYVTSTSQFARAAQRATTTTPIVLAGVLNAEGAGFVASLPKRWSMAMTTIDARVPTP